MEMELSSSQKARMRRKILMKNKENNNHIGSLNRFISINVFCNYFPDIRFLIQFAIIFLNNPSRDEHVHEVHNRSSSRPPLSTLANGNVKNIYSMFLWFQCKIPLRMQLSQNIVTGFLSITIFNNVWCNRFSKHPK